MMNSIFSEGFVRISVFFSCILIFALLELKLPRRELAYSKSRRWSVNIGISVINTAFVRLVFPVAGVASAMIASDNNWGFLNRLDIDDLVGIPLFLLAFDLMIYWQHRLFHAVSFLWRFHRMHHTDPDYDLSTGNRFHPVEILLSALIKCVLILLLGPPAVAVLIAEVVLNATSIFNHSNIRLPHSLDTVLRRVIVSPDMHRVHHSVERQEHDSNFGFNLSIWDRIFGSYTAQPAAGHEAMEIGIRGFRGDESISLWKMLLQPGQKNRG